MSESHFDFQEELSEINVTPFVDVLLVLLIIFMITAPIITKTIPVNLPKESLSSDPKIEVSKYSVTIDKNGVYSLDGQEKELLALINLISSQIKGEYNIIIRGDKEADYGSITRLMANLKEKNLNNISLLIQQKAKNK